jgi:hypothetical protein
LLSGKLKDLACVRSKLQLALNNEAKDSSNFYFPWFKPILYQSRNQDDLDIESESNGDRASSGFTCLSALDDLEILI